MACPFWLAGGEEHRKLLKRIQTAILRKVVGRNVHVQQSRKVIWDMINTLFLTLQLSNLL